MISKEFLQSYFHADYRGTESILKEVLEPIFGKADTINNQSIITTPTDKQKAQNTNIVDARHVATLWPLGSDESIKVFDVTIEDRCHIHIARKGIQHLVREWVDRFEGAFIIFHYANTKDRSWRLSYMEKRAKNTDSTSAKRYTYLCGKDYPCRTIAERFNKISPDNINSTILEQAFSAEALSDEFFVEYKNFYDDFVNYVTHDDKMFARFKQYAKNDDKLAQKSVRDYIKKLMGRLVFIQFLQKKAWLKNDLHYMQTLFKESTEKQKEDYLDNVLEPLFFGIFNTKEQDRAQLFNDNKWDKTLLAKWADFPYLNGGLFECDDLDELRLPIPSYFFSNPENKDKERKPTDKYYEDACGIFDFFERYNFTIDESDPLDTEVGVDPEMLGKIFENLLEDNKDKGAFYTPKEIVQYMCKESLIAYLVSESQKKNEASKQSQANFEEAIRAFVNDPEMTVTRIARYSEKQLTDMLESLQSVKICDPAIGSGAFPMGLLNLLVNCREALNKALGIGVPRAELKQNIILNNIYGVDIEKGAIDIARLRFWLSIVVDLESPKALPNFDYKFMQGNSLLEQFGGIDLSNLFNSTSTSGKGSGVEMIVFDDTNIKDALLQEKLHTYFSLKEGEDKHRVRQEINNAVKDLLVSKVGTAPTLVDEVRKLDISANDQFFLWHTWFKPVFDQGGFDIVIGNPPYVVTKRSDFQKYEWYTDLYKMFFELGLKVLMNEDAHLCYITPKFFLVNLDDEKMRDYFANKVCVRLLALCNPFHVVTENVITFISNNSTGTNEIPVVKYNEETHVFEKQLPIDLVYSKTNLHHEWILGLDKDIIQILSKMEHNIKLKSISKSKRGAELSKQVLKSTSDGIPSLIGQDMKKYQILWNDTFIGTDTSEYKRLETFFDKDLIYLRRVDSCLEATVGEKMFGFNKNVYGIKIDKNCFFENKYIVGWLNSKAVDFYYKKRFSTKKEDVFPEIQTYLYEQLPIAPASAEQQAPIISLVDRILAAKKADPAADTSDWENQIDELVYDLYNLSEDEKEIIRKG